MAMNLPTLNHPTESAHSESSQVCELLLGNTDSDIEAWREKDEELTPEKPIYNAFSEEDLDADSTQEMSPFRLRGSLTSTFLAVQSLDSELYKALQFAEKEKPQEFVIASCRLIVFLRELVRKLLVATTLAEGASPKRGGDEKSNGVAHQQIAAEWGVSGAESLTFAKLALRWGLCFGFSDGTAMSWREVCEEEDLFLSLFQVFF